MGERWVEEVQHEEGEVVYLGVQAEAAWVGDLWVGDQEEGLEEVQEGDLVGAQGGVLAEAYVALAPSRAPAYQEVAGKVELLVEDQEVDQMEAQEVSLVEQEAALVGEVLSLVEPAWAEEAAEPQLVLRVAAFGDQQAGFLLGDPHLHHQSPQYQCIPPPPLLRHLPPRHQALTGLPS